MTGAQRLATAKAVADISDAHRALSVAMVRLSTTPQQGLASEALGLAKQAHDLRARVEQAAADGAPPAPREDRREP